MSTSKTITRTDLTNILNEVLPTPRYGAVYTAAWTANSSAANDVQLTDKLTLTAGTYVISVKYPSVSTTLWTVVKYDDGTSVGGVLDTYAIFSGGSSSSNAFVINLTTDRTIWVASGMSTSCTYSYKERGGLRAIQISESSVHSNEADYIVEQGISGIWTYRKWNSGIAECWGTHSWTISSWAQWGSTGIFYSSYSTALAYPSSLFISNPVITTGTHLANGDAWLGTRSGESSANAPEFFLLRVSAGSTNVYGYAHIHAKGRWK